MSFQSTHPCGVRLGAHPLCGHLQLFQSTHPCGVRLTGRSRSAPGRLGFNPRTPAGCDKKHIVMVFHAVEVSIHAPLRGATEWSIAIKLIQKVSIHAPLRGATNPRSLYAYDIQVSIHAPLRGATPDDTPHRNHHRCFNPRTPAGCDPTIQRSDLAQTSFNPRTPAGCDTSGYGPSFSSYEVSIHAPLRGATLYSILLFPLYRRFNPRTPAGCDHQ